MSYLANTQTNRQTNSGKNITSNGGNNIDKSFKLNTSYGRHMTQANQYEKVSYIAIIFTHISAENYSHQCGLLYIENCTFELFSSKLRTKFTLAKPITDILH